MTEHNQDEDILLKLSMAGKSSRTRPQDAPELPEQQQNSQPAPSVQQTLQQPVSEQLLSPAPASASAPTSLPSQPKSPEVYQPQRETNTIVPPANTPPQGEQAQEDILRKLTMKPKNYEAPRHASSSQHQEDIRPPPGYIYQTPEEVKSNKPYVSTESEVERVRNLARNIYGSDVVQKRTQKK